MPTEHNPPDNEARRSALPRSRGADPISAAHGEPAVSTLTPAPPPPAATDIASFHAHLAALPHLERPEDAFDAVARVRDGRR